MNMPLTDEKDTYLVYRIYSKKERKDPEERAIFFGWTKSKNIKNAFMMQRSPKKYKVLKCDNDELMDIYERADTDFDLDEHNMISIIKLKSATTGEDVPFFSTADELHEAEINIQRLKEDLCSMETMPGNKKDVRVYLEMIMNLDPYYADALQYIGYKPKEMNILFDSASGFDDLDDIEMQIHEAYDGYCESPKENYDEIPGLPGLSVLDDVSTRIIYSLENFIRVLREEL